MDLVVVLTTVSARWEQNISIDNNGIAYTRIQNESILQYTHRAVQIKGISLYENKITRYLFSSVSIN